MVSTSHEGPNKKESMSNSLQMFVANCWVFHIGGRYDRDLEDVCLMKFMSAFPSISVRLKFADHWIIPVFAKLTVCMHGF